MRKIFMWQELNQNTLQRLPGRTTNIPPTTRTSFYQSVTSKDSLGIDKLKPILTNQWMNGHVFHIKINHLYMLFSKCIWFIMLSFSNRYSQFQDEYSLEQIMNSPKIHDPLTKLQCWYVPVMFCQWCFVNVHCGLSIQCWLCLNFWIIEFVVYMYW